MEAVANEKGVPREVIIEAIEAALASAAKKRYHDEDVVIRVAIDPKDGDYETFRRWEVVADDVVMESPDRQIRLMDAVDEKRRRRGRRLRRRADRESRIRPHRRPGRQAGHRAARARSRARAGASTRGRTASASWSPASSSAPSAATSTSTWAATPRPSFPKDKGIPRDVLRAGDRVRGYLFDVRAEPRGPQLFISRAAPEFMIELFKLEVPEVGQGLVEIKACARDPGDRAKIAVLAHDHRTDPIGACIGMRGSRVQAVSNELNGERVDIVLWSDNPAQFVINAMAPAEVQSIIVDEEKHSMDLAVAEDSWPRPSARAARTCAWPAA